MSDEKTPGIVNDDESERDGEDDDGPASNLAYYVEKFVNCLIAYENETDEEKKADAIRWAYSSILYIEDEGKEIRKMMRTKFRIKDAEVKQWLDAQEKLEAAEMAKANVVATAETPKESVTSEVIRADNTNYEEEPEQ